MRNSFNDSGESYRFTNRIKCFFERSNISGEMVVYCACNNSHNVPSMYNIRMPSETCFIYKI